MDSTQRFSTRVENYVRYRPSYSKEILHFLISSCGLSPASIIADIGSGTGFLAKLFLEYECSVFGIEPNREMREAGERLLASYPKFRSVAGSAEATTLADSSVDFVAAGQAFHWFDRTQCGHEFQRILRPGGWVVLVWNDRRTESTPFLAEYEKFLRTYGTDYTKVDHKQIDAEVLREFFGATPIHRSIPNYQRFDLPSLKGRLLSSSYIPLADQPVYQKMLDALNTLFATHQLNGQVTFEYDTRVYFGHLI